MIKVKSEVTERDYHRFTFDDEKGLFIIEFCGNLDLYWSYYPKNCRMSEINEGVFFISKSEKILYPLFNKLYRAIKYSRPFSNSIYDFEDNNKKLSPHQCSDKIGLFKEGVVHWVSDDDIEERASVVEITKLDKGIQIKFLKSNPEFGRPSFFVRFRNSGSSYHPFNASFMCMYQELIQLYK